MRLAVLAIEQITHGAAPGGVAFILGAPLVGVEALLAAGLVVFVLAATGAAVRQTRLVRLQLELFFTNNAFADGKRHTGFDDASGARADGEMTTSNLEPAAVLEARAGIEPAIEVLQTSALPLGYRANTNHRSPAASLVHLRRLRCD